MRYPVEGVLCDFMPIADFRAMHHLPEEWGVGTFEPKHNPQLGRIDGAGAHLNHLRLTLLQATTTPRDVYGYLAHYDALARLFERELRAINPHVGLSDAEIDFAVAGFSDANQNYAYACIRAHTTRQPAPAFDAVYHQWVAEGVRLSHRTHDYSHHGATWRIQTITHVYGRIGLKVVMPADVPYYVADMRQACPADGFMMRLMRDIAIRMGASSPQASHDVSSHDTPTSEELE